MTAENPVSVTIQGRVAHVVIDNPPVNATSQAVRAGLDAAVAQVEGSGAEVAILSCAGRTFVAGGDISEFGKPPALPDLPDVVTRIEASAVPFIAALHGTVLGGGFEIAMACAWRVAEPGTRFGLPEVNIGLVPGAGGSQRLPRLVGIEAAVDIACNGRMVTAETLRDLGGLDRIDADPVAGAEAMAADLPPRPAPVSARAVHPVRDGYFAHMRAGLEKRAKGQRSPLHNLDAIAWAAELPFAEGQPKERALHLALRDTAESRALRHAFFAERKVARPDAIAGAKPREIKHVAVVGGGLMGAGIAMSALMAGLRVTLIERDDAAAESAHGNLDGLIGGAVKRGKLDDDGAEALRGRLSVSTDYADTAPAQLAVEAVFEDLEVKRVVFRDLSAAMNRQAILATNTSYLDPREIFDGIPNPARCLGLHFFSPAHVMKLLEIVRLPETAADVLATGFAMGKRMGKVAVLAGICDGFIGNRILSAYRRAADYLLADGALPHEVDAAMRGFGLPMGPYELQDLTGLQIAWANRKRQAATHDPAERYVPIADRLCEAGRLGQRAGHGWYTYAEGSRRPERDPEVERIITGYSAEAGIDRRAFSAEDIRDRLVAVMVNEGALIVEEGIAESPAEIDMVEIHGYGFPRWRGGPMHYTGEIGTDAVARSMRAVAEESRGTWRISKFLG
ncbi:enoyl-CoA hydratase [Maritimibacter sp. 55A14]|uniref:FAD-dependent oxidoreductase n=1 Tax=Maritimibacter sp. 55A14 TaxID=2174844 RepID=UPI000D61CB2A|nr:FAD-dependent oxidoreductase [Maritimibacter sp. 55A14]PWE32822.1 enoyl-CoA hydratase [Maritimibacter sp. 55A14]